MASGHYSHKTGGNLECTGLVQKKYIGDWPEYLSFIIKGVAHLML